ncbi:MAG TPA: polysaccharide biosynthesis protein [Pseudogracilibacillus sp.]|nr:polysaccharide biosynthesis protein [Pseudogracilibacillus sp.]
MMKAARTNKMIHGAMLLTIAGLLSKVLSATYRIPLQNLTGDIGFFTYQQIYPLIAMVMILGLYGIPAAVSKITAERLAVSKQNSFRFVYAPLFLILFVLSGTLSSILYLFAPILTDWMGTPELASTFRLSSVLFLLLPFTSLLRGGFQGAGIMAPTAYSQVAEQLIRVTIIILAAYGVFIGKLDVRTIGTAGVLASVIAMGVVTIVWLWRVLHATSSSVYPRERIPWKYYVSVCLSLGFVAALSHMILIMLQLIDVFTMVPGLMEAGDGPQQAKEWKGVFDRGQPLIQFGVVFGSSFALALVPTIVQEGEERTNAIREALLFSIYLAGAASVGIIILMPEVNGLLFMDQVGTSSLQILSGSVVLSAIAVTACSILQNIGKGKTVALWIIIVCVLKWFLNKSLLPFFHIQGGALATVFSLLVLVVSMVYVLHREVRGLDLWNHIRWRGLIIANLSMVAVICLVKISFFNTVQFPRWGLGAYVLALIMLGAAINIGLCFRFHVFTKRQLQALPFSHFLERIMNKFQKKKDESNV